jgi:hypothetical protein
LLYKDKEHIWLLHLYVPSSWQVPGPK